MFWLTFCFVGAAREPPSEFWLITAHPGLAAFVHPCTANQKGDARIAL